LLFGVTIATIHKPVNNSALRLGPHPGLFLFPDRPRDQGTFGLNDLTLFSRSAIFHAITKGVYGIKTILTILFFTAKETGISTCDFIIINVGLFIGLLVLYTVYQYFLIRKRLR